MHKLMEDSLVIKGSRNEVISRIKRIVGSANIWAIGDVVCSTLVEFDLVPKICVFDERTLRKISYRSINIAKFNKVIEVLNPRSTISEDTLNKLKEVTKTKGNVAIRVIGEEDLIALAALIVANINSYVLYGLPGEGVVLIPVTINNKKVARRLLEKFEVKENNNVT